MEGEWKGGRSKKRTGEGEPERVRSDTDLQLQ